MQKVILAAVAAALMNTGCSTYSMIDKGDSAHTEQRKKIEQPQILKQDTPPVVKKPVRVLDTPYLGLREEKEELDKSWLTAKKVTFMPRDTVTAMAIARALKDSGITVTSSLPLDNYVYSGVGVQNVQGEDAIRMLLAPMGLDYTLDHVRKTVHIQQMQQRSWVLNLGNRRTSYSSGGASSGGNSGGGAMPSMPAAVPSGGGMPSGGQAGVPGATGGMATGSAMGAMGSMAGGAGGGAGASNGSASGNISVSDDFWASLRSELLQRMSIMVTTATPPTQGAGMPGQPPAPAPFVPGINGQSGQPGAQSQPAQKLQATDGMKLEQRQIGRYTINPETGTVTVQAPHWMLEDIDAYLKSVQNMYNASLTFKGQLVMVSTSDDRNEGVDIAAFAQFAQGKYMATISNSVYNGVVLSFPQGMPNVATSNASPTLVPSSAMMGIKSALNPTDGIQVFNAFLQQIGNFQVIQKPVLTTTSGVPASFNKSITRYYYDVNQTTSAGGTGSAAVGVTNTRVPYDLGTTLRINPRYDLKENMIRVQIDLLQTVLDKMQTQTQYLSTGNTVTPVQMQVPNVMKLGYNGEALLKDGDLIVVGGMTEDADEDGANGVTNIVDTPLGPLFGTKKITKRRNTYYFVMQVQVDRKT